MDKNLKQIKPMLCPVCGKFYFSKLTDVELEQLGATPNTTQCTRCGWFYDLEQVADPNLKYESNEMSLKEYKAWYKNKIKKNSKWVYYEDFIGDPEPHLCPVCGEHMFEDSLCSEICPICGWEDTGFEDEPDTKPSPYMKSLNETKAWFKEKRKLNPNYKWITDEKE